MGIIAEREREGYEGNEYLLLPKLMNWKMRDRCGNRKHFYLSLSVTE